MSKPHYTVGVRFGRLVTLARGPGSTMFCKCDCGAVTNPAANDLRRGLTKSCGCLHKEIVIRDNGARKQTHGMTGTPTYGTWAAMKARCMDPGHHAAKNYSARGITLCEHWTSFENFFADMGPRPEGMTLDRVDNSKGYSKENCRWATRSEQGNNTRFNVVIEYLGEALTVAQWSRKLNIKPNTLAWRINKGWSVERILKRKA